MPRFNYAPGVRYTVSADDRDVAGTQSAGRSPVTNAVKGQIGALLTGKVRAIRIRNEETGDHDEQNLAVRLVEEQEVQPAEEGCADESPYNGLPPWGFCVDLILASEGEVRIYEGDQPEPIAVVGTFEQARIVCNAVNLFRDGSFLTEEQLEKMLADEALKGE